MAAEKSAYRLADEQGTLLAWLDVPPAVGDVLLTADGTRHRVIAVEGQQAVLREDGTETLPDVPWSARETAQPVTSAVRTIGLMGDAALVRDLREGLANHVSTRWRTCFSLIWERCFPWSLCGGSRIC